MRWVILLFLIASCGGDDGPVSDKTSCGIEGGLVGTWLSPTVNETVEIGGNCFYDSDYCASEGIIVPYDVDDGNPDITYIILHITKTGGYSDCMPKGSYVCAYDLSGEGQSSLILNCGYGVLTYIKQ